MRLRDEESLKLRKRVVVPLAGIIFCAVIGFGGYELVDLRLRMNQRMRDMRTQVEVAWKQQLKEQAKLMQAHCDQITLISYLADALEQDEHTELELLANPLFIMLQTEYQISHLHFFTANGASFFVANGTGSSKASEESATLLKAEAAGKDCWGIELGQDGSVMLRYVKPWRVDGRLIGYMELGKEVEALTQSLARTWQVDLVVVARKAFWDSFVAPEKAADTGFDGEWNAFPDRMLVHSSIDFFPKEVMEWLELADPEAPEKNFRAELPDVKYACSVFLLTDVLGRESLELIIMQDVTAFVRDIRKELFVGVGIICILGLGVLLLVSSVSGRAESHLGLVVSQQHESDEKLRELTESSEAILWEFDLSRNQWSYVSPQTERILGYAVEEWTDLSFWVEHLYDADRQMALACWQRRAGKGEDGACEYRFCCKNGSVVWIRNMIGSRIEDGKLVALRGFMIDITARVQSEEELRVANDRFRQISEQGRTMIWETDSEGKYVYVSPMVNELLGYSPEEIVNKKRFYDFSPVDRLESFKADMFGVIDRQESFSNREEPAMTADGQQIWLSVSALPMLGSKGKLLGYRGSNTDITDRKEAEYGLRRLSAAINQASESVMITDAEGIIEYVNPSFELVSGYRQEEMIGQSPNLLASGIETEGFYQEMWEQISSGQVWHGQIHNRSKDGRIYIEEMTISPVQDKASMTITGYVAVKRDITHELNLEDQYQQAQKMEAIGRLAGGVAHDFNNLLQVILGYCGLLTPVLKSASPENLQYILEIDDAAQRASRLTSQLLAFSRKLPTQFEVIDLRSLMDDLKLMLTRLVDEHIEVESILGFSSDVKADVGQIEQAVMNLVVNAGDAMPDGGKITIRTENVTVSEEECVLMPDAVPGRYVCLSVCDAGVGISDEIKQHIFEPFFSTKGDSGTGLGLAAVYGIAKRHGGWISLESELGKGCCFRIYIPVCPEEERKPKSTRESLLEAPGGRAGERILLVEDDDALREVSERALMQKGYEVLAAATVQEARDIQQNEQFDLLLSDVVLPDSSGIEWVDELLEKTGELPVILCSGYTDDRVCWEDISVKDYRFLQKPVPIALLLEEVRRMLDQYAAKKDKGSNR